MLLALGSVPGIAAPAKTLNNYGQVGLFQTPTARGLGAGSIGLSYSYADPIKGYLFHAQPFEWLQGGYRFVNITNPFLSTDPSRSDFTDKGVDVQLRVFKESAWLPETAVGFMDLGGNGLFGAEYVTFSKRFFNLDVHFGVGWGRLGARADFKNPLRLVADRFEERQFDFSRPAGQVSYDSYFSGPVALFGGVVWTPFGGPVTLILEVEGNDYKDELFAADPNAPRTAPSARRFPASPEVSSRVNVGLSYRLFEWLDISSSWQRNEILSVQVSAVGDFNTLRGPEKVRRPNPNSIPSFSTQQRTSRAIALKPAVVARIQRELRDQWIYAQALNAREDDDGVRTLTLWMSQTLGESLPLAAGRASRTLIRHTGEYYDQFEIVDMIGGMESARITFPREAFHRMAMGTWTVDEFAQYVEVMPTQAGVDRVADYRNLLRYPAFNQNLQPALRFSIGGPEEFALAQAEARLAGTLQLTQGLSMSGTVGLKLADNFGRRLDSDLGSNLPRVRSNSRRYLRDGDDLYLVELAGNYLFPVARDIYGRFSAGIFETMFGGVASEVLYRRANARWAVGVDVAHVWQREFEQRFRFQNFDTTTGHLTYYHEVPFQNMRVIASVGRYLARDIGTTLDVSKRFANGARVGVFASITNVSSETFGEGSFDKGFYVSIPLDIFSASGGKGAATFNFRPLLRDGGAKVFSGRPLYGSLDLSHTRSLAAHSGDWIR